MLTPCSLEVCNERQEAYIRKSGGGDVSHTRYACYTEEAKGEGEVHISSPASSSWRSCTGRGVLFRPVTRGICDSVAREAWKIREESQSAIVSLLVMRRNERPAVRGAFLKDVGPGTHVPGPRREEAECRFTRYEIHLLSCSLTFPAPTLITGTHSCTA